MLFSDLHFLLQQELAERDDPRYLVKLLSGLFHDVEFSGRRLIDENDSVDYLEHFLTPALDSLNSEQQDLIRALLYVYIVGETTPCLLSKNKAGHDCPTLVSLSDLTQEFIGQKQAEKNLLHLVDISRTCVASLHEGKAPYESAAWNVLLSKGFFDGITLNDLRAAQLKLTQGFRTIAEMNAKPKPENLAADISAFAKAVACYQSDLEPDAIDWASMIPAIANLLNVGPYSEVKFAERMHNTWMDNQDDQKLATDSEMPTSTWQVHAGVLTKL